MLSYAEDNSYEPLNRGGITDLPLLRILLAICQKSREPSFWEVMDSFVLLAYASLSPSRTLLQGLQTYLAYITSLWTMTAAQAPKNNEDEWGLT